MGKQNELFVKRNNATSMGDLEKQFHQAETDYRAACRELISDDEIREWLERFSSTS